MGVVAGGEESVSGSESVALNADEESGGLCAAPIEP